MSEQGKQEKREGVWIYCPDDEHRPRWRCSHCGQRNRKEA